MEEVPDRLAAEATMVAHLDWIERTTASLARRYGLSPDDAEDVDAWIKLRLMEDDYAVFCKFRGDIVQPGTEESVRLASHALRAWVRLEVARPPD
jgi:hypothetical protein